MRTETDKALDAPLLLYILREAAPIYGRTKVQKTTFLVELRLKEGGLVGPHFRFIRYAQGPFSRQLWDTFDELAEASFLSKTSFKPTERGLFLIDLVIPELRRVLKNRSVFRIMDEALAWCRPRHAGTLMKQVYELEVVPDDFPDKRMKVVDVPFGSEIIDPPAGGLEVPAAIEQLIKEELRLTDRQLEEARRQLPEIERRAFRRLAHAL